MKVYGASISKTRSEGNYWLNFDGEEKWYGPDEMTDEQKALAAKLYENRRADESVVRSIVDDLRNLIIYNDSAILERKQKAKKFAKDIVDFFKEFDYAPSMRFMNTIARIGKKEEVISYVKNYFELSDNPYASEIGSKIKSYEFGKIIDSLDFKPTTTINNRLKIYFGPAGTGKTTKATEEAKGDCILCNSSMLPNDLLDDFKFTVDGKPSFAMTALRKAMVEGKTIVMDEINLLPFESLRSLQEITDNKTTFIHKGEVINIKEGFKIIGTMNLMVNGVAYALPEPLIDRCEDIKKFELTPEILAGALL